MVVSNSSMSDISMTRYRFIDYLCGLAIGMMIIAGFSVGIRNRIPGTSIDPTTSSNALILVPEREDMADNPIVTGESRHVLIQAHNTSSSPVHVGELRFSDDHLSLAPADQLTAPILIPPGKRHEFRVAIKAVGLDLRMYRFQISIGGYQGKQPVFASTSIRTLIVGKVFPDLSIANFGEISRTGGKKEITTPLWRMVSIKAPNVIQVTSSDSWVSARIEPRSGEAIGSRACCGDLTIVVDPTSAPSKMSSAVFIDADGMVVGLRVVGWINDE